MSELKVGWPPRDMLELVEQPTLFGVPWSAQWWRIRVFPNPDGHVCVEQIDNTFTWGDDGRAELVEPYAARLSVDRDEPPFLGRDAIVCSLPYVVAHLEALTVGAPTSNPRWEAVTSPGNHRHPEVMREVERLRRERGLAPAWAVDSFSRRGFRGL